MKLAPAAVLCAAVILSGCGPGNSAADTSAPAADSAYTGLPSAAPRAKPITPPPATSPAPIVAATPPANPAPVLAADLPTPLATGTPSLAPVPANNSPTPASPAPALETTPPTPPSVEQPTRPLDPNEAREQVVVLETSLGNIVIALNDVAAPRTCGNFRKLVSTGFYNHTIFHRVIPHFMIQGGDPNSKGDDRRSYGLGDPGYTLPAEIKLPHVTGAVAMARLPDAGNPHRDSNGSQFFICVQDCPSLDGKYTVFGQVIRGMDTVDKIAAAPRDKSDDPIDRIEIDASLETKQEALAETPQ